VFVKAIHGIVRHEPYVPHLGHAPAGRIARRRGANGSGNADDAGTLRHRGREGWTSTGGHAGRRIAIVDTTAIPRRRLQQQASECSITRLTSYSSRRSSSLAVSRLIGIRAVAPSRVATGFRGSRSRVAGSLRLFVGRCADGDGSSRLPRSAETAAGRPSSVRRQHGHGGPAASDRAATARQQHRDETARAFPRPATRTATATATERQRDSRSARDTGAVNRGTGPTKARQTRSNNPQPLLERSSR